MSRPPLDHRRSFWGRLWRAVLVLSAFTVFCGTGIATLVWSGFEGSLPSTDGTLSFPGISGEIRIERDSLGVPTLHATNRVDLAFATGFVHGQDRFFQMDLLRRHAAGELSALVGKAALDEDRQVRVHRFRTRAHERIATFSEADRNILDHYASGVRAGLKSLRQVPFEYQLLRQLPSEWQPEDSLLVALGMFPMLQDGTGEYERTLGLLYDTLPGPLADFLTPRGSSWDAALDDSHVTPPPLPGPDVIDLPKRPAGWNLPPVLRSSGEQTRKRRRRRTNGGSNSWAVAGSRSTHGGAILANDMHLQLMVPGVWYRASFVTGDNRITGVTLPGTPAMIVGSNGHVAWGFTNTEGDWSDRVILEEASGNPDSYLTPDGPRKLDKHTEIIHISGAADDTRLVEETIWGPIIGTDNRSRRTALRWVAHDAEALNLNLMKMETVRTVDEALALAPTVGSPAQNFLVADDQGNIGWTVLGRIPRRVGFDGRLPSSWADGKHRWDGWYSPADYPRVVNPKEGILWTANNRILRPEKQDIIGTSGYDLGARAGQIRDDLRGKPKLAEADLLTIQLDNRALFLHRWRELLLKVLEHGDDPDWSRIRQEVAAGAEKADPDSIGFRLVRGFRIYAHEVVLENLTIPTGTVDPNFSLLQLPASVEDSVWRLLTERPKHLLPPRYASWDALLSDVMVRLCDCIRDGSNSADFDADLKHFTWGSLNVANIRHPLSRALGPLAKTLELDMPLDPMAGDMANMPCVLWQEFGASERLAVSPGRETEGYFHMPAGQSGHPLSPHYRDGHAAWAKGQPTPFLPGETRHVLVLKPTR
jgi:penicillin G amidase